MKSLKTTFSTIIFSCFLSASLAQLYTDEVQVVEGLNGNVGIGVPIPTAKLDVNGTIQVSDQAQYGPVQLHSFGLYNPAENGGGDIYIEPSPGKTFWVVPTDWTQNLKSVFYGNLGIGTTTPSQKLQIAGGSILLDANQYIYGHQSSGDRGYLKLYNGATGDVEIGSTFATGGISLQTNGYERLKVKHDGTVQVPQFSLLNHYHGQKVFVFDQGTNHPIDLVASFPSVALVGGNVWAVFVKYCGFGTGGTVESREFTISRDSAGNWNGASYTGNSTDTANLASVTASGNSIIINTTAGTYVTAEVTVLIR